MSNLLKLVEAERARDKAVVQINELKDNLYYKNRWTFHFTPISNWVTISAYIEGDCSKEGVSIKLENGVFYVQSVGSCQDDDVNEILRVLKKFDKKNNV